jgi:hypothetical protein
MSRTKAIELGEKNLRIATQMHLANAFRLSVGSAKPARIRVIKPLHRGWSTDRILVPEKLFLPCFSRGWSPRNQP